MSIKDDVDNIIERYTIGWPHTFVMSTKTGEELHILVKKLYSNGHDLYHAKFEIERLRAQINELRDENQKLTDLLLEKESK